MNHVPLLLKSKDGKDTAVLEVRQDVLHVSWKRLGDAGHTMHRLHTLNPDFSYYESFQGPTSGPLQWGIFGLLILGFTALSDMNPLDKPGLYIVGAAIAAIGFLTLLVRMRKTRNTYIMKTDESFAVTIDHALFEEEALETFKHDLRQEILKHPDRPAAAGETKRISEDATTPATSPRL